MEQIITSFVNFYHFYKTICLPDGSFYLIRENWFTGKKIVSDLWN